MIRKKHIKSINENFMIDDNFTMDDTRTKERTREKDTPTVPSKPAQPARPFLPGKTPKPEEQGKPMATADEVISLFIEKLEDIKDTPEGQEIIKNLHNKYAR